MPRAGAGRWVLSFVAGFTTVGGFLADWNRTHLFNPGWPPHAKAHDAQTIILGSLLGASGLYFLWRRGERPERDLALGTLLSSFFWIAQGGSFLFPETGGFESEFPEKVPRVGGVWINERFLSALMLALLAAGYLAERRR